MAGTPITVNVSGGLQDLCGFRLNNKLLTHKDYDEIQSLHDDRKWASNPDLTWGDWVKPVWPSNRSMVGSIPTQYIFDDRCRFDDVAQAMKDWFDEGSDKRMEYGMKGHDFVMSDDAMMSANAMSDKFINHMETACDKWTPRKRYTLFKA